MARTPCAYPLDETGVSAVSLRDEVNEGAKFRRHLAVLQPEDLTYPRLGLVVRQQDLEPSGGDVFGKHLVPHQDDAGTGERGIADRERAVDRQAALDDDLDLALRSEEGPPWTVGPTNVAEALVVGEVPWVLRRAVFGEISWRSTNHARVGRERTRHHG